MSDLSLGARQAQNPPPLTSGQRGIDKFINLLQNPFKSEIDANAFWVALGTSLGFTLFIGFLFSLLRPRNRVVYAPKLKIADAKHAPPPVGKGLFAWIPPIAKTREAQFSDKIGLDATIFLRFTRMCRNMFIAMSLVGCLVLIPCNVVGSNKEWSVGINSLTLTTPLYVEGKALWAQVICSYLFNIMIAGALWWNYRAVVRLRRHYFESDDYQDRLHSRTLMVTDIPIRYRSDPGLYQLSDQIRATASIPRCVIGRNVKGLSKLIEEHENAVRSLESVLAKYLKKPHSLPAARPLHTTASGDHGHIKGQKLDAIEYWTDRIRSLEMEIKQARENADNKEPMPYGFLTYNSMQEAHASAFNVRKKSPEGAIFKLAPSPEVVIWENLRLTKGQRRWKKSVMILWVSLLTLIYIAPNAMMALFLSQLSNLAQLWPAFRRSFFAHPVWWAAVQGIASPAITSLIYLGLPVLFRRWARRAGDVTKTERERHVIDQLYAFFIFNNLIVFTTFSTFAQFIVTVAKNRSDGESVMDALKNAHLWSSLGSSLCTVSPFWVTYLLQRNLGAAVDLSQIWNLVWIWAAKKFANPTPRQRFEWTRPPPFDYASYYNYFLFYATVSLCFATLQPIVLPVMALYFTVDSWLKKYLLMYVFVTKNESGGEFWRVIFNRMIFATILANCAVALFVSSRDFKPYTKSISMAPLPFMMIALKVYCRKVFDMDTHYYTRVLDSEVLPLPDKRQARAEKIAAKFQNPALYKKLITPIVLDEARDALTKIYRGRLDDESGPGGYGGIPLGNLSQSHPGKFPEEPSLPVDFVAESRLDFSDPTSREEFGDDYGRGEIYGRPVDSITLRSDTPRSFLGGHTATPSLTSNPYASSHNSPLASPTARTGYARATNAPGPAPTGFYQQPHNESESHLLRGAEAMPHSQPPGAYVDDDMLGEHNPPPAGGWGVGPRGRAGYGGVPQGPPVDEHEGGFSYDDFRQGRR